MAPRSKPPTNLTSGPLRRLTTRRSAI